jgi:DNA gyrase subunit A
MSMSTLNHASFSIEERDAYLRRRRAERMDNDDAVETNGNDEEVRQAATLTDERYAEMLEMDQFILTLAANGSGKRTSSYEYTVRKRGGQGIANIDLSVKDNTVVASFPVEDDDGLVLVTDNGQMIRTGINEIRIAGRSTRGVIVFRVADKEHVVSVSRLTDVDDDEENGEAEEGSENSTVEASNTAETAPVVVAEAEENSSDADDSEEDGEDNV